MRIGLLGWGFMEWGGGIDFLTLVIGSLREVDRGRAATIVLLVPDAGSRARMRKLWAMAKAIIKGLLHGRYAPPGTNVSEHFIANARSLDVEVVHIAPGPKALAQAAKRHHLDVLVPAVYSLGRGFPTPWVGYIFDCQHRHLPQYFRPKDRAARDDAFQSLLSDARSVVVNAKAVVDDLKAFFPEQSARVFALPFAPAPRREWLQDQPGTLERYGIKAPYFVISNQFWVHKDHGTAFTAFESVARAHAAASLVCTGGTYDSRDPGHFPRLIKLLDEAGVRERVKILGMIPKRDQVEILKGAQAVIQPTLFEGGPGGGAVYDAVALGVPAIVSDIPVNREIRGGTIRFFKAGSAEALASEMLASLAAPLPPRGPAEDLLAEGQQRRRQCGQQLLEAMDCAIGAGRA